MRTKPLRVLNLSGALPAAAGDGSSATFSTVAALCREGAEVTYAFPAAWQFEVEPAFAEKLTRASSGRLALLPLRCGGTWLGTFEAVRNVYWNRCRSALWRLQLGAIRSALGRRDLLLRVLFTTRDTSSCLRRPLAVELRNGGYDVVQVDYPWMAQLGVHLRSDTPAIYVCHELQSDIVGQTSPDARRLLERLRRSEASFMRLYDRVVALSTQDRDSIEKNLGVTNVVRSPLAVETSSIREPSARRDPGSPRRFTFLGGFGHPPNADAVQWLCSEVMPRIRARVPDARLSIIGKFPPEVVSRLASNDVEFLGFVDDLGPALEDSIFLCPVRIASGVRIKILDAIVHGATVVSTRRGLCGLAFEPESEYLAADDAEEFSIQCRRLVEDDALRLRICAAAQRRLLAEYSPEVVAKRRLEILSEAVAAASGRAVATR